MDAFHSRDERGQGTGSIVAVKADGMGLLNVAFGTFEDARFAWASV
jgi:hypothetical protein